MASPKARKSLIRIALAGYLVGAVLLSGFPAPASTLAVPVADPTPTIETDASDAPTRIVNAIQTSEWLGPLAPIAISPFFGIACLAGLAQFAPESWLAGNQFLSENPVLHNPWVFGIFVGLTLLTSLPRLTKVSKPVAQALDQLETWGAVITLIVIRVAAAYQDGQEPQVAGVIQAGFFSFTMDGLMILAAAINVFVINSVKFFFEVLVWLTPVPAIDAIFEAANKSVCAALIAIYAYSPLVATIINGLLFAVCALFFRWIYRRVVYARHLMIDFVLHTVLGRSDSSSPEVIVFTDHSLGPFPAKSKLWFRRVDDGWELVRPRWWMPDQIVHIPRGTRIELRSGWVAHSLLVHLDPPTKLVMSRRWAGDLTEFADRFRVLGPDPDPPGELCEN